MVVAVAVAPRRRRPGFAVVVIAAAWLVFVPSVRAVVTCDAKTREAIESILAEHDANRARIKNLHISGTYQLVSEGPELPRLMRRLWTFDYYQSGAKHRLDRHIRLFPGGGGDAPAGKADVRTVSVVFNPPWRYENTTGDENAGGMSPFDPRAWQLGYYDVARLDCLWEGRLPDRRGSDWPTDIDLIKYLFKLREPKPLEAWRFAVRDEPRTAAAVPAAVTGASAGVPLKVLEIECFADREHHSLHRYTFDPARGYEMVRGFRQEDWRDGSRRYTIEATHDVKEVAPGVWRVAGVNVQRKGHDSKGRPTTEIVTITSSKALANFAPIAAERFTLTGIGVPPKRAAELEADWSRHPSKRK
jgi:hypothetical protein